MSVYKGPNGERVVWNQKSIVDTMNKEMPKIEKKGALMIKKDARSTHTFQNISGELEKHIIVRKSRFRNGGYIVIANWPSANLVEYGHDLVKGGKKNSGGTVIGLVPGKPFMRPALERQRPKILDMAQDKLNELSR